MYVCLYANMLLSQEQALRMESASERLLRDSEAFDAELRQETKAQHEEMNLAKLEIKVLKEERARM